MAGTALRGAMGQILSPTKKVLKAIGGRAGLNAIMRDNQGRMKPMAEIMFGFAQHLRGAQHQVIGGLDCDALAIQGAKRVDVAMKIFGKRAVAVMNAFDMSGAELDDFRKKQAELGKETGSTAKIMASLQLQTLGGQLKLLRSATEAVNIELFGMISSGMKSGVKSIADTLGKLSLALRVVRGEKFTDPKTMKEVKALPSMFLEIAKGIKGASGRRRWS